MGPLVFALMLVFLKIGFECERWREVETKLVVQLGVFDAPLFRWLAVPSSLCSPAVWHWLHDPLRSPLVQLCHRR